MYQVDRNYFNEKTAEKIGMLGNGYDGNYAYAEMFMRKVALDVAPEFAVKMSLLGKDCSLDDPKCLYGRSIWNKTFALELIFIKCVEMGFCFSSFLDVCAKTHLLDQWFMSSSFMDEVDEGFIYAIWCDNNMRCDYPNGKDCSYAARFAQFIQSLDDRGLGWTEKYLSISKNIYWKNEQHT